GSVRSTRHEDCHSAGAQNATSGDQPSPSIRGASPEPSESADDHDEQILPTQIVPPCLKQAAIAHSDGSDDVFNGDEGRTFSWGTDKSQFFSEIWDDLNSLRTPENACVLVFAAGASLAMHQTIDDAVAADTARHPHRLGDG